MFFLLMKLIYFFAEMIFKETLLTCYLFDSYQYHRNTGQVFFLQKALSLVLSVFSRWSGTLFEHLAILTEHNVTKKMFLLFLPCKPSALIKVTKDMEFLNKSQNNHFLSLKMIISWFRRIFNLFAHLILSDFTPDFFQSKN